jgi:3-oxoacyl-[acyl-carrier protein] reductase
VTEPRLEGRVAIVTGSTKGIGLEIARTFLAHGARVVVNSRTPKDVESAVEALGKEAPTGRVGGVPGNVGSYADCEKIVRRSIDLFQGVDILVNNAGISMVAPSLELTPQDWERTLGIDLSGPFYMSQLAARSMVERGGGSIVNVASILGLGGLPKRAAYCASKHGLVGLTKVLASEWAQYSIRVNTLSPGYIQTDMDAHDAVVGDYVASDIVGRTPMARYGTSGEVAKVALFLASTDSAYVTGENITVDGGWSAFAGWDRLLGQIKQPDASRR